MKSDVATVELHQTLRRYRLYTHARWWLLRFSLFSGVMVVILATMERLAPEQFHWSWPLLGVIGLASHLSISWQRSRAARVDYMLFDTLEGHLIERGVLDRRDAGALSGVACLLESHKESRALMTHLLCERLYPLKSLILSSCPPLPKDYLIGSLVIWVTLLPMVIEATSTSWGDSSGSLSAALRLNEERREIDKEERESVVKSVPQGIDEALKRSLKATQEQTARDTSPPKERVSLKDTRSGEVLSQEEIATQPQSEKNPADLSSTELGDDSAMLVKRRRSQVGGVVSGDQAIIRVSKHRAITLKQQSRERGRSKDLSRLQRSKSTLLIEDFSAHFGVSRQINMSQFPPHMRATALPLLTGSLGD